MTSAVEHSESSVHEVTKHHLQRSRAGQFLLYNPSVFNCWVLCLTVCWEAGYPTCNVYCCIALYCVVLYCL